MVVLSFNDKTTLHRTVRPQPGSLPVMPDVNERRFVPVELNQLRWDLPDRYTSVMVAGHGAYGTVSSALDKYLQREVAIKKLDRPFENAEFAKRTYRELAILAQMDHENVICLIDAFTPQTSLETFEDVYLVTPLMDADLGAIVAQQVLTDDQICFLAYQMLRALKYMHGAHIIHRDLKPSNIAVNSDVELRIIDFGLARQKNHLMTGYVATRWYRAPEVMLNWMHYNDSVDVWSVACILVELKTRQPLFRGLNHIDQVKQIMSIVGTPDEELMQKITSSSAREFIEKLNYTSKKDLKDAFPWASPTLLDLLSKMLVLDPDRRLTAAQALAHPYFAEYHNENDEPVGEPLKDDLIDSDNLTMEEWKEATWNLLQNFKPKLTSLRPTDAYSPIDG
ncbi:Mitogen-activated protein kinase 14 [Taenia solium]|eukprot:TsM_000836200 transcript=TsM_000836200 gene=TsM_000836200